MQPLKNIQVSSVMTEPELRFSRCRTLAEVAAALHEAGAQAAPVVDDYERFRGMLRADELAMAFLREPGASRRRTVADLVEPELEPCGLDADLAHALRVMRRQHTATVPVVDDYGVLRGLVRLRDVAEAVMTDDRLWRVRAPARDTVLAALAEATAPVAPVAESGRG